jgi:hypothetical protein
MEIWDKRPQIGNRSIDARPVTAKQISILGQPSQPSLLHEFAHLLSVNSKCCEVAQTKLSNAISS